MRKEMDLTVFENFFHFPQFIFVMATVKEIQNTFNLEH